MIVNTVKKSYVLTPSRMIEVYATNKEGTGHVQLIGTFESWDDIEIRIGHFSPDVVITFNLTPEQDGK